MEDLSITEQERSLDNENKSGVDFQTIYTAIILNWKWFVLSLIICLGLGAIYLRYTTPIYQASAKLLIKDDDNNNKRGNSLANNNNLGIISNSNGIDNEMEILQSHSLAEQAVRDLKLYVTYSGKGRVKDHLLYRNQPVNVDVDPAHLDKLPGRIAMSITRQENGYYVEGKYDTSDGEVSFLRNVSSLPVSIILKVGEVTLSAADGVMMAQGQTEKAFIVSPSNMANKYVGSLTVGQTSKTTTIAQLLIRDEVPQRAVDYLKQLVVCYNRQANADKNQIALNTEEFINGRLEKINSELGNTEGQLEAYKRRNNMVELKLNAGQAVNNADQFSQKLAEANTQVALVSSVRENMRTGEKYHTLPANVGIEDPSVNALINQYNDLALQRSRLLRSASENSPAVVPLTAQLDELNNSIQRALNQVTQNMKIQRNAVASQYGKYQGEVGATPEQERILTQIGRQQDVKSGLYLMLLQKREENSIELAATADKGKLIDEPVFAGQVAPRSSIIMLVALILGLGIPTLIIVLMRFFRYKIEGHADVARLTDLPILADVAVASDTAKTKADIVVHANKNNQMEEIFRSMRTNLQFRLKDNQKVIMFTSSSAGEGKTFNAANLAMSFALLDKKCILVGLDIRKPRLAELFEIDDHHHGITPLLVKDNPAWTDVQAQILPSGVNNNLDVLMAGPIPPNPAELISRKSLEVVIDELKKHYDYVFIDTAPVGLVTDTLQIGRVADATVYMCRADYTPKASFGLINALAAEKKLPNMSIVINGIDMSKKKYGYYYGYGRYGKYGRYAQYGSYGHYGQYGNYGSYGSYGSYGNYANSSYGDKNDTSVKR